MQPVQSVQWAPAWSEPPTAATHDPDWKGVEMNQLRTLILKHTVNCRVKWAKVGPLLPAGRTQSSVQAAWLRLRTREAAKNGTE